MASHDNEKNGKLEKRRFPRLESKHLISFEYFDEEQIEDVEGMGLSQNLSLGGILIEVEKPVRIGALMAVEIALHNHLIKATGKVIHINESPSDADKKEVGISFVQIKPSDVETLKNYFEGLGIDTSPYF